MNKLSQIISKLRYINVFNKLTFEKLRKRDFIFLYAGDIPFRKEYKVKGLAGLSIKRANYQTILHDICKPYPLPDNCIDAYQSEDVFEHIEYDKLPSVLNEIYRILKPGGYLRISVPDYRFDIYSTRSVKDKYGHIVFDPDGGGFFENGVVGGGGHLWFPIYETVLELAQKSHFKQYNFYHYYDEDGNPVLKDIDYKKGFVQRTPDNDERATNPRRPMSIVVDLVK
ncbi:MAG: methyltransferase domain-containing protein [Bacteroidales bacterium]|nr:methyltransferase domain-containing protein [Bacteroidales bacterium]